MNENKKIPHIRKCREQFSLGVNKAGRKDLYCRSSSGDIAIYITSDTTTGLKQSMTALVQALTEYLESRCQP